MTFILGRIILAGIFFQLSEQACYFDAKGQCIGDCGSNCAVCTAYECNYCNAGFGKDPNDNKTCKACTTANCGECKSDFTNCSACNLGFGQNGKNMCIACKPNCAMCGLNYSICTRCINSTYDLIADDCILITTTTLTTTAVPATTSTAATQLPLSTISATGIAIAASNESVGATVSTSNTISFWWIWLMIALACLIILLALFICIFYFCRAVFADTEATPKAQEAIIPQQIKTNPNGILQPVQAAQPTPQSAIITQQGLQPPGTQPLQPSVPQQINLPSIQQPRQYILPPIQQPKPAPRGYWLPVEHSQKPQQFGPQDAKVISKTSQPQGQSQLAYRPNSMAANGAMNGYYYAPATRWIPPNNFSFSYY